MKPTYRFARLAWQAPVLMDKSLAAVLKDGDEVVGISVTDDEVLVLIREAVKYV